MQCNTPANGHLFLVNPIGSIIGYLNILLFVIVTDLLMSGREVRCEQIVPLHFRYIRSIECLASLVAYFKKRHSYTYSVFVALIL